MIYHGSQDFVKHADIHLWLFSLLCGQWLRFKPLILSGILKTNIASNISLWFGADLEKMMKNQGLSETISQEATRFTWFFFFLYCGPLMIQTVRNIDNPTKSHDFKFEPLICLDSCDICENAQNFRFEFFHFCERLGDVGLFQHSPSRASLMDFMD